MAVFELDLPDNTMKKLRAFALLSGKPMNVVEKDLVSFFDNMLTGAIYEKLEELGGRPSSFSMGARVAHQATPGFTPTHMSIDIDEEKFKKFGNENKKKEVDPDDSINFTDEISGHEVASDAAEESTLSLEEQYEKAKASSEQDGTDDIKPFDIKAPSADNADDFLNAAFEEEEVQQAPPQRQANHSVPSFRRENNGTSVANKAFTKPRVRIAEHDGSDKAGDYFGAMP